MPRPQAITNSVRYVSGFRPRTMFLPIYQSLREDFDQPSLQWRRMGSPILPNVPPSLRRLTDFRLLNSRLSDDYRDMATHPHTYTRYTLTKSTAPPLHSHSGTFSVISSFPAATQESRDKKPPMSLRLIKWDLTLPSGPGLSWTAPVYLSVCWWH